MKKASLYLWGFVGVYIAVALLFSALEIRAGLSMADAFGSIFFGAIGVQILIGIIFPFFDKK